MKKILLGAAALIAFGTASAVAADLPARTYTPAAPVYVAPAYNWTAFYIGANLGGGWSNNNSDLNFGGNNFARGTSQASFLGGGQIGADYQFAPNWVIGIEGLLDGGKFNRTYTNAALGSINVKDGWIGALTGRLGYTWGQGLIYGKGGVAWREGKAPIILAGGVATPFTASQNSTGYTLGGGYEYLITPHWSAKIEYNYYNFGTSTWTVPAFAATPVTFRNAVNTVTVGVNYRF